MYIENWTTSSPIYSAERGPDQAYIFQSYLYVTRYAEHDGAFCFLIWLENGGVLCALPKFIKIPDFDL